MNQNTNWIKQALTKINTDFNRSTDTHLIKFDAHSLSGIDLYFKDETTHPTGSLKHRLARSLFLFALCNGWLEEGTTVVEASSGSTAVSEAYFAKLLGLPFIAVMPRSTSPDKITAIEFYGGKCFLVDNPASIYDVSHKIAQETQGHFMDQFTYAERVTDWRGNNNIAESIFQQMSEERFPTPKWVVMSAGTGGTSATIGRYIRYKQLESQLCVTDVDYSVFYDCFTQKRRDLVIEQASRIEGIGRPRCEASFIPGAIDHMLRIPDAASLGAMHVLAQRLGRRPGGSTGTNFYGVCQLAQQMLSQQELGSIVTLICDSGERYGQTYYNEEWLLKNELDIQPYVEQINHFLDFGEWIPVS
ncbi:MAG: cysteine synthase [SAR324 cluster bacterium]|uniref:L-cysteine desulfhydrase Cds1 n=1 Tax=SAR324 cluster bacterium TaxID=2024889 RepID=A0A2A4T1D5_9DELT|nr:MAG: cysteine synthase [SAR324 cluster bacterium]